MVPVTILPEEKERGVGGGEEANPGETHILPRPPGERGREESAVFLPSGKKTHWGIYPGGGGEWWAGAERWEGPG